MVEVLIVGTPPAPLLAALKTAPGLTVTQVDPPKDRNSAQICKTSIAQADHVLACVENPHAADDPGYSALQAAMDNGVPAGVMTGRAVASFLQRVLVTGAFPIWDTESLTDGRARAMTGELRQHLTGHDVAPVKGDHEIGSTIRTGGTTVEYEEQRALSLVSESMQTFLSELGEAVRTMIVRCDPADGHPRLPRIPWDPHDSQPIWDPGNARAKTPAMPNLGDVFSHADRFTTLLRNAPAARIEAAAIWRPAPPNLLILGDSGTGKSLVARLVRDILNASKDDPKWDLPFVEVNCAGMTARTFDHEMFGSAPGKWSSIGAVVGALARASYGVAFLDEIGDLAMDGQARLLKFLDDPLISPFGIPPYPAFTRIIAATNRNLPTLVRRRRFRHDLLWRFGAQVTIPPLKERSRSEKERLVDFVAQNPRVNPRPGGNGELAVTHIQNEAFEALVTATYSDGNFRELEATVHDGIRRAFRRRSRVLERDDIRFSEPVFVGDEAERVVELAASLPDEGTIRGVRTEADLDRLSRLLKEPVLREPDGRLSVITGGVTYRWEPTPQTGHDG